MPKRSVIYKLADTVPRGSASQAAASLTSLGTRLCPTICHLSVTFARADWNSSARRSTLRAGTIGSIRPAEMRTDEPLKSADFSGP